MNKQLRVAVFMTLLTGLMACNVYRVADRHIGKKMDAARMEKHLDVIAGDTVEYWDNASDKPALVLIHGFGASTKYQWFRQVESLTAHYRIIMPNLLYFGKTNPGSGRYTIQDQVDMVYRLMQHLGVKEYIPCGVSYGGLVAFELANQHPEGLQKLIAFDTPVKYMYQEDITRICSTFEVESIEELFAPSDPKGLKTLFYLGSMKKSILPASWLTEFHDALYMYNLEDKRRLITALIAGLEEYQQREYKIQVPALLVWGDNDPVVPVDRAEMLKNHVGDNVRLEIIHKGAHMPNLTETKKFNRILTDFLLGSDQD